MPDSHPLGAVVIGWEHFEPGSHGTPHLQVYFELHDTRVRRSQVAWWFPRGWWEMRYGSPREAADYCVKDGVFRSRGKFSWEREKEAAKSPIRADHVSAATRQYWAELIEQIQAHRTFAEVCTDPNLSGRCARMMQWAHLTWLSRPKALIALDFTTPGFWWQARFELFLRKVSPDDRKVIWVVNPGGCSGKSKFVKWAALARRWLIGLSSDMKSTASLWQGAPVVLFDIPRGGKVDYTVLEALKDGVMIQTKYEVLHLCCVMALF